MILVVCPNPALDVTYTVDRLVRGGSHRVLAHGERAGGKGVNVARVLAQLGVPVTVTGFLGGSRGARLGAELEACGIPGHWVDIPGHSRRTVSIVDAADATVLLEPGPQVSTQQWASLVDRVRALAVGVDLAVLAGSLPPGAPVDGYAALIGTLEERGVPAVVDATGPALSAALPARPLLVKPNAAEAAEVLGSGTDPIAALLERGARNAVVSRGEDGLVAALDGRRYCATGPRLAGNPTGSGDALAAALAAGLVERLPAEQLLRRAVALAASAVAVPHAGEVDTGLAAELEAQVALRAVDGSTP